MKKRIVYLTILTVFLVGGAVLVNRQLGQSKLVAHIQSGKPLLIKLYDGNNAVSFRGINCVSDTVVWVSGSQGVFGKSLDAGKHWVFGKINNADSLELRDIHLFDAENALVMSSGVPTRIFKTTNGGQSWQTVYANNEPEMFLDGIDFWGDGEGMAFGDPINGKLVVLRTQDFGATWFLDSNSFIPAIDGEAGFAASGSSIKCLGDSMVMIGTGGTVSRIHISTDRGRTWRSEMAPLNAGAPSQGIFGMSLAFGWQVLVGGDYAVDTSTYKTVAFRTEGVKDWTFGNGLPYQSAVEIVNDSTAISIGTPGAYITQNGGETWEQFSVDGMHCLTKPNSSNVIYTAGPSGRIAKIVFSLE